METITTIKGFDSELKCRGFQYEVDKTYTADGKIKLCGKGFHAIRDDVNPLTVFQFYEPSQSGKPSRYCVVECGGETERDDEKICCSQIKIIKEISIDKLHQKAQEWISSHCDSSGNGGDGSALTGGDRSALRGGDGSKFCGGKWSAFFVDITNEDGILIGIATAVVDDLNIKANQWYEFKNGEWTECSAPDNAID